MDDAARSQIAEGGAARVFADERGKLTLVPLDQVPFAPDRAYVLSELPLGTRRAGHACRTQHRFLVGVSGHATVLRDDGHRCRSEVLSGGGTVHIPPGTWLEIEPQDENVVILVLADGVYDPSDYVTDRAQLPLIGLPAPARAPRP